MSILIRAIITGFGLKLGSDIYRLVNRKLGVFPDDEAGDDDIEETKPLKNEGSAPASLPE